MILLFLIIGIGSSFNNNTPTPLQRINDLFNSNSFKITIERLDFGYILNQQIYTFKKTESSVSVSQIRSKNLEQIESLNNTYLKDNIVTLLANYCSSIKSFELEHNDEHKELFNTTDFHDFVYISSFKDTVLLSDVYGKAINEIRNILENNRK